MGTVLIVDDLKSERELLGKLVLAAGHLPAYAGDGEEAIARIPQVRPFLILLDVVMPKLDGFNTCRRLKREPATAAIPIVIISHKKTESDMFWGKKQGADDYLGKPFTPDQVRATIQRFIPGTA